MSGKDFLMLSSAIAFLLWGCGMVIKIPETGTEKVCAINVLLIGAMLLALSFLV